ncbi:hypothetical protein [Paenarthrobacter sp. FR1]|uniref:hypothetical protein n=1 Tax=Paenarthrobacter sp. FR1 TaxID=3439548 RepID=UPI003DA29D71
MTPPAAPAVAVDVAVTRHSDAFERALRTLRVAVGIDIVSALGVGLTMVEQDVTSGLFWAGFGVLIIKAVLSSVAAYLVRLKVAPRAPETARAGGSRDGRVPPALRRKGATGG